MLDRITQRGNRGRGGAELRGPAGVDHGVIMQVFPLPDKSQVQHDRGRFQKHILIWDPFPSRKKTAVSSAFIDISCL